jgi:ribosomal protein S18 acetylase RimI-like enzyme
VLRGWLTAKSSEAVAALRFAEAWQLRAGEVALVAVDDRFCASLSDVISFEAASEADFEELLALRLAAMRESLQRLGRFDAERSRERFHASFDARHTRHVRVGGRRVGFVVVKQTCDGLLLDHLYIHPEAQGRGIGGDVLTTVIATAEAQGCPLYVTALRDSASNRFYQRHGFVVVSESEWDVHYRRQAAAP